MYVADTYYNRIRKVTASTGIITTIAGTGTASFSGDNGAATSATLNHPSGVAVDASGLRLLDQLSFLRLIFSAFLGNVYVADSSNNRIRKVTVSTGIITTIAGTGTYGYSGDDGAATSAALRYPYGIAVDASGSNFIKSLLYHYSS